MRGGNCHQFHDETGDLMEVKYLMMPREQYDALQAAIDAGWKPESDPERIKARYKDLDFAEQVPRVIMYMDIGALLGRIDALEWAIHRAGLKIKIE